MPAKTYDAIVIGAGPAGSSASRTLVQGGMKTLMIEKKKLPRRKMCSGLLSHWSVNFVHRHFGPIPAAAHADTPFMEGFGLNFPSLPETFIVPAAEPIAYVERAPFDHFLARGSGAQIRDGLHMDRIEPGPGGYKIVCNQVKRGGKPTTVSLQSRYLIAADGSNSRAVRCMLPGIQTGMPMATGIQKHHTGKIDLDPRCFHVFFHLDVGFYAWANMKGERIVVGVSGLGHRKAVRYYDRFVDLLQQRYGFDSRKMVLEEGMAGYMLGPLNRFALGKGNFLVAGDAGGFMHNGGEGISAGLVSGDQAARAVLEAERTGTAALDHYRSGIRDEVNLCLDQTNPLRMFFTFPMKMDIRASWSALSLKTLRVMAADMKAFSAQDNGLRETGIGKVSKQNMIHHLLHRRYPVEL